MKALVTGGAGFIGSHLAEALVSQGWEVTVLDDLSNGLPANIPAGAEFVRGNANDDRALEKLQGTFDLVFHLAAVASVQDSIERPVAVHGDNLTATLRLLEWARARGIRRFIFSSSASVYGDAGSAAIGEDAPKCPLSPYAVQKLASEYYCGIYQRLYGLETVCLRYFNVFGARQRPDSPYSGVITLFLGAAAAGRPMVIFGDGGQCRDFVPVSDVVSANILAATVPTEKVAGQAFNIGSGSTVSVSELCDLIRSHYPGAPAPEHRPARAGEIRRSQADIARARAALGFRPRGDFGKALGELIASGK